MTNKIFKKLEHAQDYIKITVAVSIFISPIIIAGIICGLIFHRPCQEICTVNEPKVAAIATPLEKVDNPKTNKLDY